MKSTFSDAVRALIMLSCLIAVPALALMGAPVSKLFEPLIAAKWPGKAQEFFKRLTDEWTANKPESKSPPIVPVAEIEPAAVAPMAPLEAAPAATPAAYFPPAVMPTPHQAGGAPAAPAPLPPQAPTSAGALSSAAAAADPFQAMQKRLRELGATYYLLETWGPAGEMYRFHCRMAIDGQGLATRHFEATADDPLIAIKRVLDEVEPWVGGGRH